MSMGLVRLVGIVGLVMIFAILSDVPSAIAARPVKPDPHAGLPQNWDQMLPAAQRFVLLPDFGNAAVRDDETGLVWEQSPTNTTTTWFGARASCANQNIGGRKGWRLPSLVELASLLDPSVAPPGPLLPAGHPFTNIQLGVYWAVTASEANTDNAWNVNFSDGNVFSGVKTLLFQVWCVRGGMNADSY